MDTNQYRIEIKRLIEERDNWQTKATILAQFIVDHDYPQLLSAARKLATALECIIDLDRRFPDFSDKPETVIAYEALMDFRDKFQDCDL